LGNAQSDPLQVCPCPPGEAFSDFVATWQSSQALQLTPRDKRHVARITAVFCVTQYPDTDCGAAIGSLVIEKWQPYLRQRLIGCTGQSYYRCLGLHQKSTSGEEVVVLFDELFPEDTSLAKWLCNSRRRTILAG